MGGMFLLVDATALLFLVIPTGRIVVTYPSDLSMALACSVASGQQGILTLKDLDSIECQFEPSDNNLLSLKVEDCGYICDHSSATLGQESNKTTTTTPAHYVEFRNGLFFYEPWNIEILCPGRGNCKLLRSSSDELFHNVVLFKVALKNSSVSANTFFVQEMSLPSSQQMKQVVQCDNNYDISVRNPFPFKRADNKEEEEAIVYSNCRSRCIIRAPRRSDICANKNHITELNPRLTFWFYLILRLVFGIALSASMTLFDGACLAVVNEVKGDLGIQRIFGLIALMIFTPISAMMMDYFTTDFRLNYKIIFSNLSF